MGAILAQLALPLFAASPDDESVIDIGSRLELFVDDYLIEEMAGVRIQQHRPQSAGVALKFDEQWEGTTSWQVSGFKDGEIYRLYYLARSAPEYVREAGLEPGETFPPEHPVYFCYAESRDGITWTKPNLGLVEFNGSKENNIIFGGDKSLGPAPGTVFLDTNPDVPPEERYKAVVPTGKNKRWPANLENEPEGILLSVSSDGIHWKRWSEEPIFRNGLPNAFDSINVMFWSEAEEQYVLFFRYMHQNVRTFARVTSKDLRNWSEPELADFGDTPRQHLYTNAATPYYRAPHITLAFPKRYVPLRKKHADYPIPGISETVFMSSRDGMNWQTYPDAFIRPGRDDRNWMHRTTGVSAGIMPTSDDELSIYVSRHYTAPSAHLERFVIRTDGFTSIYADASGGEFITKPLKFEGDKLVLNYATSAAGSIRVEVLDLNGQPIPGFELSQCEPIWGDDIEREVVWERPEEAWTDALRLKGIREQAVRLRFVLKEADLYSLRFQAE